MKNRSAPHSRVVTLSLSLLVLMVTVVGLGIFGVSSMQSDFETLTEDDFPRFDELLHIDRDLFRGQRALENALLEDDPVARTAALEEYSAQVDRTAERWASYLEVTAGVDGELEAQAAHDTAREAWLQSTTALADATARGATMNSPGIPELLAETQADFIEVRTIVHDLEEEVAEPLIVMSIGDVTGAADRTTIELLALLALGIFIGGAVATTTYRATRLEYVRGQQREEQQRIETRRASFEADLAQALTMAQTEEAAIDTVGTVLQAEAPGRSVELLLADSSHAHLAQVVVSPEGTPGPGCGVLEPSDCPAVRRGTSMEFVDGDAYSSCPHLRRRGTEPCSAFCVPVSVAGRTVGVLHSTGTHGERVDPEVAHKLEEVADRAGDRIGVLRAFAQSQTQAATDPLTGLHNRRSFENEVSRRLRFGSQLAVAYGDLDHFKALNDRHGHDAGDRALRLFARIVRETIREVDIAARWGGEEFVIAFDGLDAETAAAALQRLQENLVVASAGSSTAPFTVSFGVADTTVATDLEKLVQAADESLLEAKARGRDRVLVSGRWDEAVEVEAPTG